MAQQYIFTIENLSKAFAKKEVLKGIWLSFYPGAKIGVLGGNGSGKSTLLRIMAGVEKDYIGTARPAPGISIGYLPQEPTLDPTKTVLGNVEQAVAPLRALLTRFDADQRPARRADRRRRDGQAPGRTGQRPGRDRGGAGVGPRPQAGDRHGRHAAPARATPTWPRSPAANGGGSRSARSSWNSTTSSCSTSPPTTSTPRASPGSNATSTSTPARSSP